MEKDPAGLVDEKLNMSLQCVLTAQEDNCTLGCSKRRMASRLREVIFHCPLVRPYLEYYVQVRVPSIRRTWPCSDEEPEEAQKDD